MKNLLTILLMFLFTTNVFSTQNFDTTTLFLQIEAEVSEAQLILNKFGRDKISDDYFGRLNNLKVVLAQQKADPEISKEELAKANELYFDIDDLLLPSHVEKNQLKRQMVNKGFGSAIIRGVVSDALTGEALVNLNVRLYDELGNFVGSTSTDDQGRYIFNDLLAGDYAVLALVSFYSDHISTVFPHQECPGGLGSGCQIQDLNLLTVDTDEILQDIDIVVSVKPTVTGRVFDSEMSNVSLSSAYVTLYDGYNSPLLSVFTDQFGRYKIFAPETGSYYVVAEKNRYEKQLFEGHNCYSDCIFSLGTSLELSSNSHTGDIDFALDGFSDITGTLSDAETSMGLESGRVYLLNEYGNYVSSTHIYESNKWKFESIPSGGTYYVGGESDGYLAALFIDRICQSADIDSCDVTTGVQVGHSHGPTVDVDILMSTGANISGEISSPENEPLSNVEIYIYNIDSDEVLRQSFTDQNGQYVTGSLADGQYYVVARRYDFIDVAYPDSSCENHTCNFDLASLVTIENGQNVSDINFQLNRFGQVRGQINNISETFFNAQVRLRNETTGQIYNDYLYSDDDFHFDQVLSGSYQIYIIADGYYPETYDDVRCVNYECTGVDYTSIIVEENSETDIDFSLTKYGQVELELSSNSINPVSSGNVFIYDATGEFYGNGSYHNSMSLPEGDYYFEYIGSSNSYYNQFVSKVYGGDNCFDNCDATTGILIHVEDESEQTLSMNLDEFFYIAIDSTVYNSSYTVYNGDLSNYAQGSIYNSARLQYIRDFNPKKIKVSNERFFSQLYDQIDCIDQECDLSLATEITPQLNSSLTLDFDLTPLTSISGIVLGEDGTPLSDVSVSLLTYEDQQSSSYTAFTNSNGEYSIQAVAIGDYFIRATLYDYPLPANYTPTFYGGVACEMNCTDLGIPSVAMNAGDQLTGYDIEMSLRGTLSGEGILNVDGLPVSSYIDVYRVEDSSLNYIVRIDVETNGTIDEVSLSEGQYKLIVTTNSYPSISSSFPSQICEELNINCVEESQVLTVSNGENTHFNGFIVHQNGQLQGSISSDIPDLIMNNVSVKFYKFDDGLYDSITYTNNGYYSAYLSQGLYYVVVSAPYSNSGYEFFDKLHDDINCIGGLGVGCSLSQGQFIEINYDTVSTLDMSLTSKPRLNIAFADLVSQKEQASRIKIYDIYGNVVFDDYSSQQVPSHQINAIDPGEYYILGSAGLSYDTVGFPDIICDDINSITTCQESLQPISLDVSSGLVNVNLHGMLKQGVSGYVKKDFTEQAISNIIIDFWDDGGFHLGSTTSSSNGGFSYELSAGNYYISTDTGNDFMDEVYENVLCESAAILGFCDVTEGQLMNVPDNNIEPILIDIDLGIDPIFSSTFE